MSSPIRPKTFLESLGNYHDFQVWITRNKLTAIGKKVFGAGGTWLAAVSLAFGAQFLQKTPMTLKLIQTRIAAQGITIAALCGAAAVSLTDEQISRDIADADKDGTGDTFKR